MADLDIQSLVAPVSEDSPCGDDLEYDPEFGELDRIAQGKPGHEMGEEVIEPQPPNWDEVADAATALFVRTKDLRVATHLAHAQLNLDGLPGLASGLELIKRLLQDFWDQVHPQLDEEDDNDPTLRMNSLTPLNSRDVFIRSLDRAVLVSSKALGRFSLRDIRLASGEVKLPDGDDTPVPDPAHIDAAFLDCELEELTGNSEAASQCVSLLNDLEAYTSEQVGAELAPELGNLSSELNAVRGILNQQLSRRGVAVEAVEGEAGEEAAEGPSMSGEIRSRDDAIRVLDRVSEYFRRNEPSSPVPLLLQRAKRLISKDFMEILRDIAPQGVSDAEMISGLDRDE
jgi:type VI secretion system protein ImpA